MKKAIWTIFVTLIFIGTTSLQIAYAQDFNKDLSIESDSVKAPSSILVGKSIRIYTTVTNHSDQDLSGVVKYYDENRGSFIEVDQPVSVLAGKTDDVFVDWKGHSVGNYSISVRIVPWDEDGDDPSNNKVTKTIYVDVDSDGDGISDRADRDDDNDGVSDNEDEFPFDPSESKDTDGDGIGNNVDTDDDNDGISDIEDAFPLDIKESVDTDGDGVGDNSDVFPNDPNESVDSDSDGLGDNSDPDNNNHGPIPQIGTENTIVNAEEIVGFNALRSRDPDGEIIDYKWIFEDGTESTGVIIDYVFKDTGRHKVTLLVTDNKGEQREQTIEITVIYKWQTIALIFVTTFLILLLILPWLFSRRKKDKGKSIKVTKSNLKRTKAKKIPLTKSKKPVSKKKKALPKKKK